MPRMDYIPKYITKRLVPTDGIKLEDGKIKVKFINVLSPISIEKAPANIKDFIELKIDGELIYSKDKRELEPNVRIEYKNKQFTLDEIKKMGEKGIIAVGDSFNIIVPNSFNFKSGETHKILFTLNIGRPYNLDLERTLQ